MRTKWTVLLWMLMISGLLAAQNTANTSFQVKGILLDSLTQEGEPYATIKIVKKEAPAKALKMLVTDMKGQFQEKVPGTGNFVMTITSVGRTPIVKDFSVKAGEKLVDFGTLYIVDASNELGQVEIVAQKPLVKADIDKIEYNVQDDPDAQSNSVLEMLRKVPLVTVDGEDNIQVNGSSSFKVYVNGKPNNMMSNNPTEVLKSMPANSIKHIEVITNPGPKYEWTRHNVGFLVIDQLADREKLPVQRLKHKALTNTALIGGKPVLLMKPTTYMNLSGEAVGEAARFYKIPPDRVLVISDDVSLPQGKLRVRRSGSAGGHNGLKNIISHLGTDQFPRIKVGVGGKPHPDSDMADWVLSKFTGPDRQAMEAAIARAADAVTCLLAQGVDQAMARYNG